MKERIIIAFVIVAVVASIAFLLPVLFTPFLSVVLGISVWEWCRIGKISGKQAYGFALVTGGLWFLASFSSLLLTILLALAVLHYLYAIRLIWQYQTIHNFRINRSYLLVCGPVVLSALAASLYYIFQGGEQYSLEDTLAFCYILLVISAADSGAYFVGYFLGKHKLLPKVSPQKTIEGLLGGLFAVLVVSLVFSFMVSGWYLTSVQLVSISMIAALFSVIGDLFISVIKRQHHIKDTSKILRSHGGILDRIDGLIAGVPVFYLLQQFM